MLCSLFCVVIAFALVNISSAVECNAESGVLIEAESGDIVFEKNAYEQLPMASTTKIMTAIVAIEKSDLDKTVTITADSVGIEGSSLYLKAGEQLTMRDLLYGLLLQSANDAAVAIAVDVAGSVDGFASMMNEKAAELGLLNSHFTNPNGLDDDNHYTTAYDLAVLTSYALNNKTFAEIVSTYKYTIGERVVVNHNKLLKTYDGAIGVKTGYTKRCGRCLVSAAERDGVTLVAVTLNDPSDWNDHASMLDYGFTQYKSVELCKAGSLTFELSCAGGVSEKVTVANKDAVTLSLKKDSEEVRCIVEMRASSLLFCPIEKDAVIADAVFYMGKKEIARVPLYTKESVAAREIKKSLWDRINIFN